MIEGAIIVDNASFKIILWIGTWGFIIEHLKFRMELRHLDSTLEAEVLCHIRLDI